MEHVRDWEVMRATYETMDFKPYEGRVQLVSGGPPCQPFSISGKHLGHADERNMFPEAIRAIRGHSTQGIRIRKREGTAST